MYAFRSLGALAALLPAASAAVVAGRQATTTASSSSPSAPAASTPPAAAPTGATAPWISVDASGVPRTITPVLTTISGTPTLLSGAPDALTASVFTRTSLGDVRVSTGPPPPPSPTSTPGAGAFPVCSNRDGPAAPFCLPAPGAVLNPGTTYYVTWDPTFFASSNATVVVTGSVLNASTGAATTQAFASPRLAAAWAFYAWTVDAALLAGLPAGQRSVNVTLFLAALDSGAPAIAPFRGPTVAVADPAPFVPEPTKPPQGPALYIGLPAVLGLVVLVLVGTCIWNRKTRRIGLGNVMSRGRDGYAVGKSRARRVLGAGAGRRRREKAEGIRLMERDVGPPRLDTYRDGTPADDGFAGWEQQVPGRAGVPRRDSDALGSLVGTPTEERRMEMGGGNAFRDEVKRQERDRL